LARALAAVAPHGVLTATSANRSGSPALATADAVMAALGTALFGEFAGRILSAMVVVAVAGSLAAMMLAAPRLYPAMARDGVLPGALARVDLSRGVLPVATLIQVALANVLILLGSFDQILGYFVPATVFFLGLSAAAIVRLPRPSRDSEVFVAPGHPLPIVAFLALIVVLLVLFVAGQPFETLLGALVAAAGFLVSVVVKPVARRGFADQRPSP
jgi:APA family basic amino acid/polyamine antiporter